jgi:hypothetical protein
MLGLNIGRAIKRASTEKEEAKLEHGEQSL